MEVNFFSSNIFFPSSKQKLFSFLHIEKKKKIGKIKKNAHHITACNPPIFENLGIY